MILSILQHTPVWVFALFAALVYLGIQRTRPQDVPIKRLLILPVAMGAFSLFGLVSAFGDSGGLGTRTLAAWIAAYALVLAVGHALPARRGVQYSPATGAIRVPGSWLPLVLMMTIFFLRYTVAVLLAMNPGLRTSASFAIGIAAVYGISSACFAARTLRVWRSREGASPRGEAVAA